MKRKRIKKLLRKLVEAPREFFAYSNHDPDKPGCFYICSEERAKRHPVSGYRIIAIPIAKQ